jgi:hypothetical protein
MSKSCHIISTLMPRQWVAQLPRIHELFVQCTLSPVVMPHPSPGEFFLVHRFAILELTLFTYVAPQSLPNNLDY